MPIQSTSQPAKAFLSLSELAEDVLLLSRARVYELIERGALPWPVYDTRTRRPVFTAALIHQARTVRQTGVGVDGSVVIFYRREGRPVDHARPVRSRRRALAPEASPHAELAASLRGLGINQADDRSVAEAVSVCFPHGIGGQQPNDLIRVLFRHFRRQQSA